MKLAITAIVTVLGLAAFAAWGSRDYQPDDVTSVARANFGGYSEVFVSEYRGCLGWLIFTEDSCLNVAMRRADDAARRAYNGPAS